MTFDPFQIDLPITDVIEEVRTSLNDQETVIIHAPPGAGKSTLIPLALLEESWLNGSKIIMLEPRRLAAKSIAMRLAELLGEKAGETIGYRIRFETKVSDKTRIEVVTEGILTRMLHSDSTLEGVGLVIFDEFHERSIHADVALALCRESQQIIRPDLKMLIMSATLNVELLTRKLGAPVISSKGRQYPVEIFHKGEQDFLMLPEMTARTIIEAVKKHDGDVLAFFPGQGEILKCEEILRKSLKGFVIHPLFGQLPYGKQQAAIFPNREGKRKIVLATSIAETSLTIEGIKIVVDTGYGRTQKWDPRSGLSRLETVQISRDSADQRTGRAGRLSAGVSYRLWSKATDLQLAEHRTPEISETDLSALVLDLALWKVLDPNQLTWLTPPPKGPWMSARETLHELEALENGKITAHGERMHQLPCHPRLAHMLLMAEEEDLVGLAADIAALLEERDPLGREAGIDINLRIEALRRHRSEDRKAKRFLRIEKVAASYRQLFEVDAENEAVDPYETGLLLTHAFPERIACARPGNNAQFQLSNGRLAMAGHRDDLAHEAWLAVANLDARDGMGKIFLASPLNPQDLATRVKEKEVIIWDSEEGGLVATKDLRIGSIVLKSTPLPNPDPVHLVGAISRAIQKEGRSLLTWDDEVTQWQNRVLSLRKWHPGEDWPDVSRDSLLVSNEEWIGPYLSAISKPGDLKKLRLTDILQHNLPFDKQQQLDKLAPKFMKVPSGSSVQIMYREDGEAPVLAARIQELFGLAETPTVDAGKMLLLIHLLSPGFKPVQVTTDLKSFWSDTYFEVKKDLKRRYPKHYWPDDPTTAEAIRGVKRK